MIQYLNAIVPERFKLCGDVAAGIGLIMYWLDKLQGPIATLASAAALVYTVIRTYYYFKDRAAGKE